MTQMTDTTLIDTIFQTTAPNTGHSSSMSTWQTLKNALTYKPKAGDPALDGRGKVISGSRFVKRIVVEVAKLYLGKQPARQEDSTEAQNAKRILTSFQERGFVPTDSGQGIIVERIPDIDQVNQRSPRYNKEFDVVAGFHRTEAHNALRQKDTFWSYTIVDVYEYDTPLARQIHAGATNTHYTYRAPSNESDIRHQIDYVLEEGLLLNDETAIQQFVESIAAHMPKKTREKIVNGALKRLPAQLANGNQLRSLTSTTSDTDKLIDTKSTHRLARAMDLPVRFGSGVSRTILPNSYGDIQTYFTDEGSVEKALAGGTAAWFDEGCPPDKYIHVAQYVNTRELRQTHQNPRALEETRTDYWKKAQTQMEQHYTVMVVQHQRLLDAFNLPRISDEDLRAHVIKHCPVVLSGFLPQVTNPDPMKGGMAIETTMVGPKGLPYDYKPALGRS